MGKHIQDIAARYIIPRITVDGAEMFASGETVFGEGHTHHAVSSLDKYERVALEPNAGSTDELQTNEYPRTVVMRFTLSSTSYTRNLY